MDTARQARRLWAGASGFAYPEWKGSFYPAGIKSQAMLPWYAGRLPTVEINNSFYRMPQQRIVEGWAAATPAGFRFAFKAPRRITHMGRLDPEAVAAPLELLYRVLGSLGEKRGPVLFQLPPYARKDPGKLRAFLGLLPGGHAAAFEFRHESWFCDEVYDALRATGAALCHSEREDSAAAPPLAQTAGWGYVRLRRESYSEQDLRRWASALAATGWREIYAYFMHEPTAPEYARMLMSLQS